MSAKKVLAAIFAGLTLVKLLALLLTPDKWLNLTRLLLRHQIILNYVYLALLAIIGYLIFSSLNLIDIALVMFFTSLLTGLFLLPYSAPMFKLGEAMAAIGLAKAWLPLVIWGALAVAVLAKVFSKKR
jgi:hypothetical protein